MTDEQRHLITRLLTGSEPDDRRHAAEAMADAPGPNVEIALVASLEDPNKGVRDAAARSLIRLGGPSVARALAPSIASRQIGTRNLASSLLTRLGPVAAPPLLPFLKDPNKDVRKFAIDILGEIRSTEASAWIIDALDDADPNVVVASLEALGKIGRTEAVRPITEIFPRCGFARTQIIETLGRLGGNGAVLFLTELARSVNSQDFIDEVEWYALAEALGTCGGAEALEPLLVRAGRVSGPLRRMILHAIIQICERVDAPLDQVLTYREDLLTALEQDPLPVRLSAARSLQHIPGDGITGALVRVLGTNDDLDLQLFTQLSHRPRLFHVLSANVAEHLPGTHEIVLLLGKIVREIVDGYAEDRTAEVTGEDLDHAFQSVQSLWDEADQELRFFSLETLFRLDGDRAVGFLNALLADADPWVKVHILELLFDVEDQRVLHIALACLQDDEETVRMTARATLEARGVAVPDLDFAHGS